MCLNQQHCIQYFFSRKLVNDVALLRTKKFIAFGGSIGAICLATSPMPVNQEVTATGWGYTNDAKEASDLLKEVSTIDI